LNHRKLEPGEYRAWWLSFEKEVEAPRDEALHFLALGPARPTLEIGSPDRNEVSCALAVVVNADLAQPVIALWFCANADHRPEA
jgi:hypothetical protein